MPEESLRLTAACKQMVLQMPRSKSPRKVRRNCTSMLKDENEQLRERVQHLERDLEQERQAKDRVHDEHCCAWQRAMTAEKELVKIRHRERDIRPNLLFKSL